MNEKELYLYAYDSFLIQEAFEQSKMEQAINVLILGEGSTIEYVTEGFIDKIKEFLKKISEKFQQMLGSFLARMDKLFKSDQAFLSKYKSIILNTKMIETTVDDWYDYNLQEIVQPSFLTIDALLNKIETGDIKGNALEDARRTTEEIILNNFKIVQNVVKGQDDDKESYIDRYKASLRGGPSKSIETSKIDMKRIYDFLYSYRNKVKPSLEKTQKGFEDSLVYCNKVLVDIEKVGAAEQNTNANTNANSNQAPGIGTSNSGNSDTVNIDGSDVVDKDGNSVNGESAANYYRKYYFNELTVNKSDDKSNTTAASTGGATDKSSNPGANIDNSKNKDGEINSVNKSSDAKAVTDFVQKYKVNPKNMETIINAYCSVTLGSIGALLTVSQECYNEWFKLVKWHVFSHNTKSGKVVNKTTDKGEKYTDPNQNTDGDQQNPQDGNK